jgi:hypothetical protein
MSTFFVGAGTRLAAGLQPNYFYNKEHGTEGQSGYIADTTVDTLLNITSVTFDPAVEKGTEENLLVTKVKDSSYLLNLTMDGSFSANLRPEMTDWLFKAATQNPNPTSGTGYTDYTLAEAGNDPLGSTLVLDRTGDMTDGKDISTFPGMVVSSMTLSCPNNDFVSVDVSMTGREEIKGTDQSAIPSTARPETEYEAKDLSDVAELTKAGYIVTNGVFKWNNSIWCIQSCNIALDNAIEASRNVIRMAFTPIFRLWEDVRSQSISVCLMMRRSKTSRRTIS